MGASAKVVESEECVVAVTYQLCGASGDHTRTIVLQVHERKGANVANVHGL